MLISTWVEPIVLIDEVPHSDLLLVGNFVMDIQAHFRLRPVFLVIICLMFGLSSHKNASNAACNNNTLHFMVLSCLEDGLRAFGGRSNDLFLILRSF